MWLVLLYNANAFPPLPMRSDSGRHAPGYIKQANPNKQENDGAERDQNPICAHTQSAADARRQPKKHRQDHSGK